MLPARDATMGEDGGDAGGAGNVEGGGPTIMTQEMVRDKFFEYDKAKDEGNERLKMMNKMMREMAGRLDEVTQAVAKVIPQENKEGFQMGGGLEGDYRKEMEELRGELREMGGRIQIDPRTVEEIQRGILDLKNIKETMMMNMPDPPGSGGGPHKPRGWDTRKLKLEPYEGDRKEWRSFAFTLKAFIRREAPGVESYMSQTEHTDEELDGRMVSDAGVDMHEDKELAWLLTNYTGGEIKEMIQLNEDKTGCELWRILMKESDPKSGTSGVQAMQKLMSPGRCKSYSDLKKALAKWDALLKAEVQRGGPSSKLGPEVKATAIISMVPKALEEEILKKGRKLVESYRDVRQFVDDMVYMYTIEGSGNGVSLGNVEEGENDEGEIEINDEQGNILVGTITQRNGAYFNQNHTEQIKEEKVEVKEGPEEHGNHQGEEENGPRVEPRPGNVSDASEQGILS
jgi:hypothetical protein